MARDWIRPRNSSSKRRRRSVKLCEGCVGNWEIRPRLHCSSCGTWNTPHTTHCTLLTFFWIRTLAWACMLVYVLGYRTNIPSKATASWWMTWKLKKRRSRRKTGCGAWHNNTCGFTRLNSRHTALQAAWSVIHASMFSKIPRTGDSKIVSRPITEAF